MTINGMDALPGVFTSEEDARRRILAHDYPELSPEVDTPEG